MSFGQHLFRLSTRFTFYILVENGGVLWVIGLIVLISCRGCGHGRVRRGSASVSDQLEIEKGKLLIDGTIPNRYSV